MKMLKKLLIDIALFTGLLLLGFQAGKYVAIPKGKILVNQTFLDSLSNIKDTVIVEVDTVPPVVDTFIVIKKEYIPITVDDSTFAYRDSLVNKQISVHVFDTISNKGLLKARQWQWTLFVPETIIKTEWRVKTVPIPYKVVEPIYYKYYAGIGYDFYDGWTVRGGVVKKQFMFGAEVGKQTLQIQTGILW